MQNCNNSLDLINPVRRGVEEWGSEARMTKFNFNTYSHQIVAKLINHEVAAALSSSRRLKNFAK